MDGVVYAMAGGSSKHSLIQINISAMVWSGVGEEIVLALRRGRFRAELIGGAVGRNLSWLEPDGVDRWRVVEGRERGEILRAVRDDDGAVTKLYLATYPLTRAPSTFG